MLDDVVFIINDQRVNNYLFCIDPEWYECEHYAYIVPGAHATYLDWPAFTADKGLS
jgi:hypothetical protein